MEKAELVKHAVQKKHLVLWEYYKRNPLEWIRACVKTIDEHDSNTPVKDFPIKPYTKLLTDSFYTEPVVHCPKSRQIMATWLYCALCLHEAQFFSHRLTFLISKKAEDAEALIKRIRHIYTHQPLWVRNRATLAKKIKDIPKNQFEFANGSLMHGLPQGAEQVRSHTASRIFFDEAAFQDNFESVFGAASPSLMGGGRCVAVSSAEPGFFETLCRVTVDKTKWSVPIVQRNDRGHAVIFLHYSADPDKNPETDSGKKWIETAEKFIGLRGTQNWEKEMEINWGAGGGQTVFPGLEAMEAEIYLPNYKPADVGTYFAGFDWGRKNPVSFHVYEMNMHNQITSVWEFYERGWSPLAIAQAIKNCPYYSRLQWIAGDPMMWSPDETSITGFKSMYQLFVGELPEKLQLTKLVQGQSRLDEKAIVRIEMLLASSPSKLRISQACPNQWRELKGLKHPKHDEGRVTSEKIVDKDNHSFDDLKYALSLLPTYQEIEETPKFGTMGYYMHIADNARAAAGRHGNVQEIFNNMYGKEL